MRNMHFMSRNNRLPDSVYGSHIRTSSLGRAATPLDARIAVMRAGGMSIRAIRRALGLSEAAATAAGLLEPGRLVAAPAPDGVARNARSPNSRGGPGGSSGSGGLAGLGMAEVLDAVTRSSGIDREDLVAPGQRPPAVRARQLVMVLVRELCPQISLPAIGFLLHRDRTTVLYGCRRAKVLLRRDPDFRAAYLRTRRALIQRFPEVGSRG